MQSGVESQQQQQQRQFLRRAERLGGPTLPVDPSVVFEEGRGVTATPSASRQRPRFATARDLDDALLQAIEGKITRKNAWVSKDASNLLEGITHTVESTLDAATETDEYSSFAKVATVVEGCSKVWTSRVDSTYQRSNQMVRRLLRNEEGGNGSEDEGNGENGNLDPADPTSAALAAAAERRRKAAQRRGAQSARTLALDPSEINLDSKARVALVHTGVSAQFRAITEKFDQGNAQGLLLHNTPMGNAGNLILDVDYAREVGREYSTRRRRLSGGSRQVKEEETETENIINTETLSSAVNMVEVDLGLEVELELPPFPPVISSAAASAGHSPYSVENGGANGLGNNRISTGNNDNNKIMKDDDDEAGRPSVRLPSLLLLPHNIPSNGEEGVGGVEVHSVQDGNGMTIEAPLFPPINQNKQENNNNDNDIDGGDWGGGGMDYDDGYDDYNNNSNMNSLDIGDNSITDTNNDAQRERIAAEARQLVSGVSELNAMDGCLFGENRLALEAEDPTSWFPLAEPPTNVLIGNGSNKNSELLRLHKEHRFTQISTQPQVTPTTSTKRIKREKTIAFDLPGELTATAATGNNTDTDINSSSSWSFLLNSNGSGVDSSSLKQSTTPGKNMTPLGKELLLGRDPDAVLVFTQSTVQRAKAHEAGLLLQEPPIPGKTVPTYMPPHPITIPAFFQPFSTPLLQWNLLRKSATGRALGFGNSNNSNAPSRRVSGILPVNTGGINNNNNNNRSAWGTKGEDDSQSQFLIQTGEEDLNGGVTAGALGDMPVEFFHAGAEADDDYMGAGGYDDYDDYNDRNNDNNNNELDDPVHLAQAQILSSFERAELARVSSGNNNNNNIGLTGEMISGKELLEIEPIKLARVLQAPQAALPSQVDVVKLRQTMWASVSEAIQQNPIMQKQQQEEENENEEEEQQQQQQQEQKRRKRGRTEAMEEGGWNHNNNNNETTEGLPRFSDVVLSVLPQVSMISATGTLSPAFFFFSILFLANEHGVLLESVEELNDLIVRGVTHPISTATNAGSYR